MSIKHVSLERVRTAERSISCTLWMTLIVKLWSYLSLRGRLVHVRSFVKSSMTSRNIWLDLNKNCLNRTDRAYQLSPNTGGVLLDMSSVSVGKIGGSVWMLDVLFSAVLTHLRTMYFRSFILVHWDQFCGVTPKFLLIHICAIKSQPNYVSIHCFVWKFEKT